MMRITWDEIVSVLLIIFTIWPWLIGIVDIGVWATTGAQLTTIPWDSARGATLFCWPIITIFIFGFIYFIVNG